MRGRRREVRGRLMGRGLSRLWRISLWKILRKGLSSISRINSKCMNMTLSIKFQINHKLNLKLNKSHLNKSLPTSYYKSTLKESQILSKNNHNLNQKNNQSSTYLLLFKASSHWNTAIFPTFQRHSSNQIHKTPNLQTSRQYPLYSSIDSLRPKLQSHLDHRNPSHPTSSKTHPFPNSPHKATAAAMNKTRTNSKWNVYRFSCSQSQ